MEGFSKAYVRNLGKNKIFGEIKKVIWLSKIPHVREREDNIRGCFINEQIDFKYPNNIKDFRELLESF